MTDNPYAAPQTDVRSGEVLSDNQGALASRWTRLFATLIDNAIAACVIWPVLLLILGFQFEAVAKFDFVQRSILALCGIAFFLAVHGYLLAKYGQTVGKRLLGIRIANREDGSLPPFWPLIVRRYGIFWLITQVPIVGSLVVGLGVLLIFRQDRRCLHDLVAGTVVVKA